MTSQHDLTSLDIARHLQAAEGGADAVEAKEAQVVKMFSKKHTFFEYLSLAFTFGDKCKANWFHFALEAT